MVSFFGCFGWKIEGAGLSWVLVIYQGPFLFQMDACGWTNSLVMVPGKCPQTTVFSWVQSGANRFRASIGHSGPVHTRARVVYRFGRRAGRSRFRPAATTSPRWPGPKVISGVDFSSNPPNNCGFANWVPFRATKRGTFERMTHPSVPCCGLLRSMDFGAYPQLGNGSSIRQTCACFSQPQAALDDRVSTKLAEWPDLCLLSPS